MKEDSIRNCPEYKVWAGMRERCNNPNCKSYPNYGGRGITVCDRWKSFESFLLDMGPRPSAKHTLDRKDTNGNYTPENCRWATWSDQNINKRQAKRNPSGTKGVRFCKVRQKWAAQITRNGVQKNLGYYEAKEDAVKARLEAEETLRSPSPKYEVDFSK